MFCARIPSNRFESSARAELKEKKLLDELHFRTLERIFIEERIYKKIEQCKTNEAVFAAVYDGFNPQKRTDSRID